jgi:hypothetical protein
MDTDKRIEQYLRAAPQPLTPDGLGGRLQNDVAFTDAKTPRSVLRGWFAPAGGPVSLGRVAAAAILAVVVLLPLTYAGSRIVRTYFTEGPQVEVMQNEDGSVTKTGSLSVSVSTCGDQADAQDIENSRAEIEELKKAGQFERTLVREWTEQGMEFRLYEVSYTLSSGKVITMNQVEAGSSPAGSE